MKPSWLRTLSAFLLCAVIAARVAAAPAGTVALGHIRYLADTIGNRVAGSKEELAAANYLVSVLRGLGYTPSVQPFTWKRWDAQSDTTPHPSQNVIAVKPGLLPQEIIVGAHYDSVTVGTGADDNASGVAVLLELAAALRNRPTPYTVRFVFFGAEEVGLYGSTAYADAMTPTALAGTVGMINLDSMIAGDKLYAHARTADKTWVRDAVLASAQAFGYPFETNPGRNSAYPYGTTGDWSDHEPFARRGLPVASLEATNWDIGALDGYTQTEQYGEIWHTKRDRLDFIEQAFPGRTAAHLEATTNVLLKTLLELRAPR